MYIKKGDKVQVLSGKDRGKQQGGIVSQEAPIDASNVNLLCPECGKVTRVGHEKDGKNKLRVCKKCGHKF